MMEMPMNLMAGPQVVIERPAGREENRGLSPNRVLLLAQTKTAPAGAASAGAKFDMVFEECRAVETQVPPGGLDFSPNSGVGNYWNSHPIDRIERDKLREAKVTVLQEPQLGTLRPHPRHPSDRGQGFAYDLRPGVPNGSEDRVIFLLEVEGKRIKVVDLLKIVFNSTPESKDCKGKDHYIKRLSQLDGPRDGSDGQASPIDLLSQLYSAPDRHAEIAAPKNPAR